MAIRMREWATAPGIQPGGVVVPMNGVASIGKTGEAISDGLKSLSEGVGALAGLAQHVSVTGELSAFRERLTGVNEQAQAELKQKGGVQDYAAAWSQISEPRLTEAMRDLSEPARAEAGEIVQEFRRNGMIEAMRTGGLGQLDRARSQWEAGVRQAAVRGDSEAVERHLAVGENVFMPSRAFRQIKTQALDAACLARWSRLWENDPVRAVAAMDEGGEQPSGVEMRQALQRMNEGRRKEFRNDFASMLAEMDDNGAVMEPASLQLAQRLKLIDDEQARLYGESHAPGARDTADHASLSRWKQRIDTMAEDDDSLADIRIGIATSGFSGSTRRALFKRLETARQLPRRERSMLDARLERYCREGYLGAPEDQATWLRKNRVQDELIDAHASRGVQAAIDRLETMLEQSSGWVCYKKNK